MVMFFWIKVVFYDASQEAGSKVWWSFAAWELILYHLTITCLGLGALIKKSMIFYTLYYIFINLNSVLFLFLNSWFTVFIAVVEFGFYGVSPFSVSGAYTQGLVIVTYFTSGVSAILLSTIRTWFWH